MLQLIWLIPLLPLVGVAVNGLFGRRMPRAAVCWLGVAVVLGSFLLSVGAVMELAALPEAQRALPAAADVDAPNAVRIAEWLPLGEVGGKAFSIGWGFALDPLSAVLLLVVTGVGFLIHVYSVGYMEHEADFARFFVYINLFMAMMSTLVLADNLLVLFVGWEGVGLCSYLLIGFFYDKPFDERTGLSCADAGRKAFIVNRIGDFAFLIGMLYLVVEFGTLHIGELTAMLGHGHGAEWMLTGIGLLLFVGACGKSAQIPLYVWLPDAMAGPTPVSALIHAATMVTAGVFMVCRMSALYDHAPEALFVVAVVGSATALFAALMGITATDIKKVLAYSTVSQLGYMFAAAGVGAYVAAMFHLMTHAFFKALLFLGAGSVIHGLHGQQDITKMGAMREKMPWTFRTFVIATLAIAGIVPFAGFFSKDEILWGAWSAGHPLIWGVLAVGALITAFYMMRLTWLVFFGNHRGERSAFDRAHESPATMIVPLGVLALLSIVGGFVGVPAALSEPLGLGDVNVLHHWLAPAVGGGHGAEAAVGHGAAAAHHDPTEYLLMALALVLAVGGLLLAVSIYRPGLGTAGKLAGALRPAYTTLRNLFWVDELYELVVLRPFYALSRWFAAIDRWIVDGAVNAAGITAELTGQVIKLFHTGLVRNYALMFLVGVVAILYYLVTL